MRLLLVWLVNALSLLAVAYVLPSVTVASFYAAVITALVLAVVNTVIRPVLVLVTLPINILTLGLFTLVINGLLFWFVASFVEGFRVDGFWAAFLGALLYSGISTLASSLLVPRAR
jgi:putative membrane protein